MANTLPGQETYLLSRNRGETERIWLKEIARTLPSSISPLHLQGFDISAAQFPPQPQFHGPGKTWILLSVHDILKKWPAEHRGRYDFVHIRLLTAALKTESYKVALKNVRDLLKPNGYVQWEEVDITTFHTDKTPQIPAITKMSQSVRRAMIKMGMSPFAPQRVYEELCSSEFRNIHRQTYTTKGKEYLHDAAQEWVVGVIRALVVPSMIITGEAMDEAHAKSQADVLVAEFEEYCKDALPLINFTVVVAQL
ncbi:unnamed protein product [Penicillium pancosmium]